MARREEVTAVKWPVSAVDCADHGFQWASFDECPRCKREIEQGQRSKVALRTQFVPADSIERTIAAAGYVLSEDWSRLGRDALVGARIRHGESYEVQEGTVPPWMEELYVLPISGEGKGETAYRLRPLTDEGEK